MKKIIFRLGVCAAAMCLAGEVQMKEDSDRKSVV